MLITLSSRGELSPSRFTNYLSDTQILKPFSKIALVNLSITVSDSIAYITIPAGQFITVMFDCWNIMRIPLLEADNIPLNDWVVLQNDTPIMSNANAVYRLEFEDTIHDLHDMVKSLNAFKEEAANQGYDVFI